MKKIMLFMFFGMIVCSSPVWAQFEGIIDFNHTFGEGEGAKKTSVSVFVKNNMMVFTPNDTNEHAGEGKMIYRGDKQVLWIVDDTKQEYLEIDISENRQSSGGEDTQSVEKRKAKVALRKTGKKATLLGYSCEEIIVDDADETHTVLGTSKLGSIFEGMAKSLGSMKGDKGEEAMDEWRVELMKMKLFPMKTVSMRDGKVTEVEEVTKIEKKSLSASMFDPPESYAKHSLGPEMNQMMQQLQKQMKKHKDGAGNGEEDIDMEKMMKEMQEKLKDINKNKDSTKDKDDE